jgi:DNA-binding GntR family transcriptional regulator
MTKDLQQGKFTLADLSEAPEEALATQYDASRDTVRKVRNKILSRSVDNSNSDK